MRSGLLYGIAACCGWGFAFIGPLILGHWPALAVAAGRYIAYGGVSVLSLLNSRRSSGRSLGGVRRWRDAALLSLSGNLLYYMLLCIAVQKAGFVLPTLVIGLLPVTVSLAGRLRSLQAITPVYALALGLILAGLTLANAPPAGQGRLAAVQALRRDDLIGMLCAFAALALWTVYALVNTERLHAHAGVSGVQWASLQGAATLPFALVLLAATPGLPQGKHAWETFIAVSLGLGVLSSWAANSAWNRASQHLPPSLLGQVIVFETIAGIGYGSIWSQAWPSVRVLVGAALLVAGVLAALRELRREPQAA